MQQKNIRRKEHFIQEKSPATHIMIPRRDQNTKVKEHKKLIRGQPDLAIMAASPTVFRQMVLPPVLGPVITRTLACWAINISKGTGRACLTLST